MRTFKVLYLFSGISRKASIAEFLSKRCANDGYGLEFWEVDILIHGKEDDMLDKDSQRFYLEKIESGYFDMQFLSPPCGSWSRANYANDLKPQPCRGRKHPWGFPNLCASQRRRAESGNEFIHFSIHAIVAAQQAKARGFRVMSLWEHPEDLGMTHRGEPASVSVSYTHLTLPTICSV